jgi:hypothetical protein
MTNLTKVFIGTGILGAGILGTPIIYNNQINKFIEQEKSNLQSQDIELKKEKNNDSFFKAKRKYIITIKDITPILQKIYPTIDFYTLRDLKKTFDNTKFLITLNMLKFPIYHKDAIKIDLYSFNDDTQKELLNDKVGKEILEAIKNKAFELILDINNLKVSKAKLKDIDLTLNETTTYRIEKFNLKIKKASLNIESNNLKISKLAMNYTKKSEYDNKTINFNINNIDTKTKQQDLLNNSSNLKITSINYTEKSNYKNTKININNISNLSSTKTITNKTSINNKLDIKNIYLSADKNYIKINNVKYNFNIFNIYTPALKEIIKMTHNKTNNPKGLIQYLNILIQKGFKIYISPLSINSIKSKIDNQTFDIKPIKINFDATLLPNNFSFMYNTSEDLLNNTNAKLKIHTYKENIDLLNQKNPQIGIILNKISQKLNNNKIILKIEYNKGKITSNGKSLF